MSTGRDTRPPRPASDESPYDVVAAVDLLLSHHLAGARRRPHVTATGVDSGVGAVRARAEDDQVAHLLVGLADRPAVPLLRVGLVGQLLARGLAVHVHRVAGTVERPRARGAEDVPGALVPGGFPDHLGAGG